MKFSIKLFNFYGSPVNLKLWFFLLFLWLNPLYVLAIFISILLHELGHAFVANRFGHKVDSVYVDIFSGGAIMDLDSIPPKQQMMIIGAGPWMNFMLLCLSIFLQAIFPKFNFLWHLSVVNFLLFVFNILPIFPLDGGRLLRNYLIIKTNNIENSIKITAWLSIILSLILLVFYIVNFSIIMVVFCLIFIIYSIQELVNINSYK